MSNLRIPDFLFRNQITTDVINSVKYLIEKTLNGCNYNPKVISIPMVRPTNRIIYFFEQIIAHLLLAYYLPRISGVQTFIFRR